MLHATTMRMPQKTMALVHNWIVTGFAVAMPSLMPATSAMVLELFMNVDVPTSPLAIAIVRATS